MATGEIEIVGYFGVIMMVKRKIGLKKRDDLKIKAVIFDIGGVLRLHQGIVFRNEHLSGVHEYVAKKLDLEVDDWFDMVHSYADDVCVGKMKRGEFMSLVSKNANLNVSDLEKAFKMAYIKLRKRNSELYRFAHNLKKKGFVVGVLSNQWNVTKPFEAPDKDMRGFDPVIISCDVGLQKPDKKIYRLLFERVKKIDGKIKKSEIVFIDNMIENIEATEKFGIKGILFESNEQVIGELKGMGVG